jgi:hypothetical protein
MRINATTIITIAEQDIGQEETAGANRSPWLDPIQRRVSEAHGWAEDFLIGQPWCGTWLWDVYRRAGFPASDNPGHPSTETMWARATAAGTLTDTPVPGAAIVWRGVHTGLVVAVDAAAGVVHTIEGNSSDGVRRRVRALRGNHRYIVPKGLTQAPPTRIEYWLEDLRAQYRVVGPWRTKVMRDRQLKALAPAVRRDASPVTTGDGRYAIRIGQARHIGPWSSEAARKKAQPIWEARRGRRLRAWNKTRRVPAATRPAGAPEALGRTQ